MSEALDDYISDMESGGEVMTILECQCGFVEKFSGDMDDHWCGYKVKPDLEERIAELEGQVTDGKFQREQKLIYKLERRIAKFKKAMARLKKIDARYKQLECLESDFEELKNQYDKVWNAATPDWPDWNGACIIPTPLHEVVEDLVKHEAVLVKALKMLHDHVVSDSKIVRLINPRVINKAKAVLKGSDG